MHDLLHALWAKAEFFLAVFAGGLVRIILQEERSLWTIFVSFTAGLIIAWMFGGLLARVAGLETITAAAVLAMTGRDLAAFIILAGKDPPGTFNKVLDAINRLRGGGNAKG